MSPRPVPAGGGAGGGRPCAKGRRIGGPLRREEFAVLLRTPISLRPARWRSGSAPRCASSAFPMRLPRSPRTSPSASASPASARFPNWPRLVPRWHGRAAAAAARPRVRGLPCSSRRRTTRSIKPRPQRIGWSRRARTMRSRGRARSRRIGRLRSRAIAAGDSARHAGYCAAPTSCLRGPRRSPWGQNTSQHGRDGSVVMDHQGRQEGGRRGDRKAQELGPLGQRRPDRHAQPRHAAGHRQGGGPHPHRQGVALGIPLDASGPQNGLFGGRFNPIHQMLATGTGRDCRPAGLEPDPLRRRHPHSLRPGRHPLGRAGPRVLRGQGL